MTYDLCLYGHLTVDRIYNGFHESASLGAMANVWHALTIINPLMKVKLCPLAIGEAIILINRHTSERIGRANLNALETTAKIEQASWHHVMYLNALSDASFISSIESGIISADITAGNCDSILPFLHSIDFLFISDEDLFMDLRELASLVRGKVILHSASGSIVAGDHGDDLTTKTASIKNLNVLGAGDIFAASFISVFLATQCLETAINQSHRTTTSILLNRQSA